MPPISLPVRMNADPPALEWHCYNQRKKGRRMTAL